jgi:hypothetical protein
MPAQAKLQLFLQVGEYLEGVIGAPVVNDHHFYSLKWIGLPGYRFNTQSQRFFTVIHRDNDGNIRIIRQRRYWLSISKMKNEVADQSGKCCKPVDNDRDEDPNPPENCEPYKSSTHS